jgi:pyridoxal phosphate enzyme (YggS family)
MPDSAAGQRVADNLARVRERIGQAAAGKSIRLVCVTKYARHEWVEALLAAGAQELGESLLPQGAGRFSRLQAAGWDFKRHLIGAQQSRKVKLVPDACDLFQALDRAKTAELLQAELVSRDAVLPVLLEVNIDAEPQKHGYAPEGLEHAVSELSANCPQLELHGLMAIPRARGPQETPGQWEGRLRSSFRQMRTIFDRMAMRFPELTKWSTLSMGMSQDYAWAIAEGATMVRVGSALFSGLEG